METFQLNLNIRNASSYKFVNIYQEVCGYNYSATAITHINNKARF